MTLLFFSGGCVVGCVPFHLSPSSQKVTFFYTETKGSHRIRFEVALVPLFFVHIVTFLVTLVHWPRQHRRTPMTSQQHSRARSELGRDIGWLGELSPGTKDWICGIGGGLGKAVVGYPFDTIKGRVQTGKFPSVRSAVYGTVIKESPLALYQGFTMPAFNVCFISGVLFYTNGLIKAAIQPVPYEPLTYVQMLLAGAGGGVVVGVLITPLEVLKIRMQIANKAAEIGATPSTPKVATATRVGLLRATLSHMNPRDLGAGFTTTVLREAGTFGIFFPMNEYLKRKISLLKDGVDLESAIDKRAAFDRRRASGLELNNTPPPALPELPFSTRVLAAGTGGVLCWLPVYPIDQVKSRMQIKPVGTYTSWLHCALEIYQEQGIKRGFFKGLEPCLLRAFPAYAAQFLIFAEMMNSMSASRI